MSSLVVLSLLANENKLISYFKNKNATKPNSAIVFDIKEFEKQGYKFLPTPINPSKVPYIKSSDSGKFYLDEETLKQYRSSNQKIGFLLLAVVIFIFSFIIFLKFF